MSAIAGIYEWNQSEIRVEHCQAMMEELKRYRADDVGTWKKDSLFFGCHAQWITEESIGEKLPFYDSERNLAITADAIIDNRDELFNRLGIDIKYRASIKDSELLLHAYSKWEEDMPKFLVGDFTFMIWDEKKGKLFGARDFSGCRTLYFFNNEKTFAFCTAINPLFSLPFVSKKLNEAWLAEFLAIPITFESTDSSSSVYENIRQLPPAHSITVERGRVKLTQYCTLDVGKRLNLSSNEEYEEAFLEVFKGAVKSRLRTHLNVGAHLSGGLDSGSVASIAARELRAQNKSLHTYSYVPIDEFEDWSPKSRVANERPSIKATVNYVGNIRDSYLSFPEKSSFSEIDDWLDVLETPYKFYENSFWTKGIFEQASQQGIGVILNGQRGNWTVSWGHALDYQAMLLRKLQLRKFSQEVRMYSKNLGAKRSRVLRVVGRKVFPKLRGALSKNKEVPFRGMINEKLASRFNVYNKLASHGIQKNGLIQKTPYEIRKIQFQRPYYWALNGAYTTKLSLRYGIWDRDPTNDLRVVRFCLSVPESQFVQNGQDRSLIRRAMKGYLPDDVRLNQRTRGIQGADGIQRMLPQWNGFIGELERALKDDYLSEYLNIDLLKESLENIRHEPSADQVFRNDFRILMRSLILYRFLQKNF
ncbi:asparagine synthetase B [Priestia endophytica]|uniref:asparagine synthase-related protein n=1 Tax=Priestia endophytica TaxID=135735 RepID=UPI000DCA8DBE|nr:asparagine synthase-related protein [Priestia endophytica]RAS84370.1 asparagine synthetase B [Priestia endophytica]